MKPKFLIFIFLGLNCISAFAQNHWAQKAGSIGFDKGYAIATDNSENVYSTGTYYDVGTFGSITIPTYDQFGYDAFIVNYNSEGVAQWVTHAGGTGITEGHGIAVDASHNIYVCGFFNDTAWFGNTQLVSAGQSDFFIARLDSNGVFQWAKKGGGISNDIGTAIHIDLTGNLLVTGNFTDSADFSGTMLYSHGQSDVLIAKYDNSGNLIWIHNDGGLNDDTGNGITTDNSGNFFVTGAFRDSALFSSTQIVAYGGDDIFIVQYDSSGIMQWVNHAGGQNNDKGNAIATDQNGNIHITGSYDSASVIQFDATTITPKGGKDLFIAVYNNAGNLVSVMNEGSGSDEESFGITLDSQNNTYITGAFLDSTHLGNNFFVSHGQHDVFVIKYDSFGNFLKAKQYGGSNDDYGYAISTDAVSNCLSTGFFEHSVQFGNTSLTSGLNADIFFVTFNDSITNATGFTGSIFHTGNSGIHSNNISDVVIDKNNNLWVATRDSGISFYDGSSWTYFDTTNSLIPENKINSIFIDSLNVVWLSTPDSGLVRFDGTTWTTFNTSNSNIGNDNISSVTSFSGGPLWIGTKGNGCVKYDNITWTDFNTSNSTIPDDYISTMNVDSSHHYWIGTENSGITMFDGITFTVYNTSNSNLPDNHINGAFIDQPTGRIWIATPSGLASFDGSSWQIFNSSTGYPDNNFNDVAISNNGNIASATKLKGTVVSNGTVQRVANTSNILFDNDIVSIAVDSSGKNYWFGTQYNGVYLLHDTSSIVAIKNIPAWSTMDVAAYPNPSQDVFTIQYSLKQACNVNITVSDLLGRKCDEENFNNQQAGKHIKLLSLKKNPVGIYFVKIISGTQIGVTRLVKE